jgi:hypothetical protein
MVGFASQKHSEKLQKSLEESQRGLAIAADFAREQALLSNQDLRAQEIELPHFEMPGFPKLALPDFDKIVLEASTQKARAGALRIADSGWVTADWMAPGYVAGFARSPHKEIDSYFVKRYLGGASFKGRLRFTADELLASPQLKKWKPLLRQTFECLQAEKYVICVPALISVIEEFASESLINALSHPRSRVSPNKGSENAKRRKKETIDGLFWSSAILLVNHMFTEGRYNRPGPSFENRHGISDNQSQIKWNRVDAAKLVILSRLFTGFLSRNRNNQRGREQVRRFPTHPRKGHSALLRQIRQHRLNELGVHITWASSATLREKTHRHPTGA